METESSAYQRVSRLLSHLRPRNTLSTSQSMRYVLVTGASRGIGYGLVEHLLLKCPKYFVIATCRTPTKAIGLQQLVSRFPDRSALATLDVSSSASISQCVCAVEQMTGKLHVLISSAGIGDFQQTVLDVDSDAMTRVLQTNVVGPALMFKGFHKLLTEAATKAEPSKVINVSSRFGSLDSADLMANVIPATAYRVSKAALNMLTRGQAYQTGRTDNIIVTSICPGHVGSDMGTLVGGVLKLKAEVSTKESAKSIAEFMEEMNMKQHSAAFYGYDPKEKVFQSTPW